jgi:hypothetical protein
MAIILFMFDQLFMLLVPFLIKFRHGSQKASLEALFISKIVWMMCSVATTKKKAKNWRGETLEPGRYLLCEKTEHCSFVHAREKASS